jgi:hypothetical protein
VIKSRTKAKATNKRGEEVYELVCLDSTTSEDEPWSTPHPSPVPFLPGLSAGPIAGKKIGLTLQHPLEFSDDEGAGPVLGRVGPAGPVARRPVPPLVDFNNPVFQAALLTKRRCLTPRPTSLSAPSTPPGAVGAGVGGVLPASVLPRPPSAPVRQEQAEGSITSVSSRNRGTAESTAMAAVAAMTGTKPKKVLKKGKKPKLGDKNYTPTPQERKGTVLIAGKEWPLPKLNFDTGLVEVQGIDPNAVGRDRVTPASGWGADENDPRNGKDTDYLMLSKVDGRLHEVYTLEWCHWCILFGEYFRQDRFGGLCKVCKRDRGEA